MMGFIDMSFWAVIALCLLFIFALLQDRK